MDFIMTEYVRYQDYYENSFLPLYDDLKKCQVPEFNNDILHIQLCDKFVILFEAAYLLLKYYLHNNGLFQFNEADVIRECFYIEILQDGEEWMSALKLTQSLQSDIYKSAYLSDVKDFIENHFYIFDKLKENFSERCKYD